MCRIIPPDSGSGPCPLLDWWWLGFYSTFWVSIADLAYIMRLFCCEERPGRMNRSLVETKEVHCNSEWLLEGVCPLQESWAD